MKSAQVEIAAGVAAPVLTCYVIWLLHRAQTLGLTRLYFISRDGYILKAVAEKVARRLESSIELRYLYGSRQAWHLPSLLDESMLDEDWIRVRAHPELTLHDLLARIGLEVDDIPSSLYEQCREKFWNGRDSRDALETIIRNPEVRRCAVSRSRLTREVAQAYFRQEGLCDDSKWAIVDVGWRGRAQRSLARMLQEVNSSPPRGFYFGLRKNACGPEAGRTEAFLFDDRSGYGLRPDIPPLDAVIEMFCCAPHGMTTGYREEGGVLQPIFRETQNDKALEWGIETTHETIVRFAESLPLQAEYSANVHSTRPMAVRLLEEFWEHPSEAIAAAWGRFGIESDQVATHSVALGRPFTMFEALKHLLGRRREIQTSWRWPAGSRQMSTRPVRTVLKISDVSRMLRHHLKSRLKFFC